MLHEGLNWKEWKVAYECENLNFGLCYDVHDDPRKNYGCLMHEHDLRMKLPLYPYSLYKLITLVHLVIFHSHSIPPLPYSSTPLFTQPPSPTIPIIPWWFLVLQQPPPTQKTIRWGRHLLPSSPGDFRTS